MYRPSIRGRWNQTHPVHPLLDTGLHQLLWLNNTWLRQGSPQTYSSIHKTINKNCFSQSMHSEIITQNVFTGSLKCYLASLILSASRGVHLHQNKIKSLPLGWTFMSCSHCQELGQLAVLASDRLLTLVQPIRSQLACWHNFWQWLQLISFHPRWRWSRRTPAALSLPATTSSTPQPCLKRFINNVVV